MLIISEPVIVGGEAFLHIIPPPEKAEFPLMVQFVIVVGESS